MSFEAESNSELTVIVPAYQLHFRFPVQNKIQKQKFLSATRIGILGSIAGLVIFCPLGPTNFKKSRLFHMFISQSVKLISDNIWIVLVLWHRLDVYNQKLSIHFKCTWVGIHQWLWKVHNGSILSIEFFVGK